MDLFLGCGEVNPPYRLQAADSRCRANLRSSNSYEIRYENHNENQYAYSKFRHCSHFAVLCHVACLHVDTV